MHLNETSKIEPSLLTIYTKKKKNKKLELSGEVGMNN